MGYNPKAPGRKYHLKKRKAGRGRKVRRGLRMNSHGHFRLKRKMPEIHIYSGGGATGVAAVSDPTGTCVTLGTAVNVPGTSSLYNIPFTMVFRLDQLPSYSEITTLADRYKINSVSAKIRCSQNSQALSQTTPNPALPWLEWIADHDDGAVQTAAQFRERMGVKTRYFGADARPVTMYCKPRNADVVFNNGITTAYQVPTHNQWLNSSYVGIEHYAIKGILHEVSLPTTIYSGSMFSIDVTFDVSAADIQ